jgi:uncharacterized protein YbjT (DUF2867 family)
MKRVLVAGATGYLGRYVVRELKNQGYWVRALVRAPEKLEDEGFFLQPAVREMVDELFVGEVTRAETLQGLCDDVDFVISSIGITRQRDKVSFMDVDYRGNKHILECALEADVKKFVFVSVYKGDVLENLARARELFVKDLVASGLNYTVIRPTAYFSDMSETLKMASSGRVYMLGDGSHKINPIHGADLAKVCVDSIRDTQSIVPVGGPETFTHEQIAELAFSVLNKKPKLTRIPLWLAKFFASGVRMVSKHYYTLMSFFITVMENDFNATEAGERTLKKYFETVAIKRKYV